MLRMSSTLFYSPAYHKFHYQTIDLMGLSDANKLKCFFDNTVFAFAQYLEKAWTKEKKHIWVTFVVPLYIPIFVNLGGIVK